MTKPIIDPQWFSSPVCAQDTRSRITHRSLQFSPSFSMFLYLPQSAVVQSVMHSIRASFNEAPERTPRGAVACRPVCLPPGAEPLLLANTSQPVSPSFFGVAPNTRRCRVQNLSALFVWTHYIYPSAVIFHFRELNSH